MGSDASKNLAENIEKSIHSQATSEVTITVSAHSRYQNKLTRRLKDEYDHRCAEAIEDFQQRTSTPKEIKAEPTTDDLNEDGPSLGSYVQVTFHKTGLFSTIFKALAPNSFSPTSHSAKQYVALKVTTPSAMIPPHDSKREVRILEESRSERIIPLLAKIWQPGDRLVLAFPFMPFDLDVMMRDQEIETRNVNGMIRDIFQGLSHLHDLGIIHRDVKPSNLLLKSRQGPAYLADFGIAWSPQDSKSEPAQQKITDVGTTSYRAPEVLFGFAAYGTELDLWAAGCTVAQILRPGHQALFTAGDLGSELALIKSIFSNLGTPNEIKWPVSQQTSAILNVRR